MTMQAPEKQTTALSPIAKIKLSLSHESTRQMFKDVLNENAGSFIASILDLYQSDTYLQKCDPNAVIRECMKAASLKLPINKNLGFAYVIPYKSKDEYVPQFQMGYRGYIQLAMRTGQFRFLNVGVIFEGMSVKQHLLTGEVAIDGEAKSDKAIGYFAYMELVNGFRKTFYMTREKVEAHAKRFSKSYTQQSSPWKTDFDAMAQKTCIRALSKFFPMTVEMAQVLAAEGEDDINQDIEANANKGEVIEGTVIEGQKTEATKTIDPGY